MQVEDLLTGDGSGRGEQVESVGLQLVDQQPGRGVDRRGRWWPAAAGRSPGRRRARAAPPGCVPAARARCRGRRWRCRRRTPAATGCPRRRSCRRCSRSRRGTAGCGVSARWARAPRMTFSSGSPATNRRSWAATRRSARGKNAELAPPTCGEISTFGIRQSGCSGGSGSGSVTSRAARIRPVPVSATRASVSTSLPRATLTSRASSGSRASRSASIRPSVSGVSGAITMTTSASRQQLGQLAGGVHPRLAVPGPAGDPGDRGDLEAGQPTLDGLSDPAVPDDQHPLVGQRAAEHAASSCPRAAAGRSRPGAGRWPGSGPAPARRCWRRAPRPRCTGWRRRARAAGSSRTRRSASGPRAGCSSRGRARSVSSPLM